jgi:hypothetical protein
MQVKSRDGDFELYYSRDYTLPFFITRTRMGGDLTADQEQAVFPLHVEQLRYGLA